MKRHPFCGLSVPERGWVPAPRYVMRRHRVLKLVRPLAPGRLVEIGTGAGALLSDLAALGFLCEALESSQPALELARYVNRHQPRVTIRSQPAADWSQGFDLAVSLEVLEHIEDDVSALEQWRGWLKPGGRLLLSVPARTSRWSASDVFAGHYRRYEWRDLEALLSRADFTVEHGECYGFPLSNLIEPFRARMHRRLLRRRRDEHRGQAAHTAQSGIDRSIESRWYRFQASWLGTLLLRLGCWLQERFRNSDLGTGYLILARRS